MWNEGDTVLLRGMYAGRPAYIQSTRLIRDTQSETVLAIWPGAECVAPAGYLRDGHGPGSTWNRWEETLTGTLFMQKYLWHTNRFLIFLEPDKYYALIMMWNASSEAFLCYYVNFQLPFQRSRFGFDTLDMDLDIVIEPSFEWHWKDVDDYQRGIRLGGIRPEWVSGVETARSQVASRLRDRLYPFDGSWLAWRPDPAWPAPRLPEDWSAPA